MEIITKLSHAYFSVLLCWRQLDTCRLLNVETCWTCHFHCLNVCGDFIFAFIIVARHRLSQKLLQLPNLLLLRFLRTWRAPLQQHWHGFTSISKQQMEFLLEEAHYIRYLITRFIFRKIILISIIATIARSIDTTRSTKQALGSLFAQCSRI